MRKPGELLVMFSCGTALWDLYLALLYLVRFCCLFVFLQFQIKSFCFHSSDFNSPSVRYAVNRINKKAEDALVEDEGYSKPCVNRKR